MRKLIFPVAIALGLGVFATGATAGQVGGDDSDDDVVVDDTDDDASPVPEPGAALAMGAGLATIAFALRRGL